MRGSSHGGILSLRTLDWGSAPQKSCSVCAFWTKQLILRKTQSFVFRRIAEISAQLRRENDRTDVPHLFCFQGDSTILVCSIKICQDSPSLHRSQTHPGQLRANPRSRGKATGPLDLWARAHGPRPEGPGPGQGARGGWVEFVKGNR